MPIEFSTNHRMRSGFAVIPSMQRSRSTTHALRIVAMSAQQAVRDDRLEHVELQLPRLRRHRHRHVAADDVEADLVHDLGDHRVDLARA